MSNSTVSTRVQFYQSLMTKLLAYIQVSPRTKLDAVDHLVSPGKVDRYLAQSILIQALNDRLVIPVEQGSKLEIGKAKQQAAVKRSPKSKRSPAKTITVGDGPALATRRAPGAAALAKSDARGRRTRRVSER